ncbi:MAG TPA: hypothetical protein VGM50_16420 [Gemmatimonadaceae bacterium]|jgi:hypothetical protein
MRKKTLAVLFCGIAIAAVACSDATHNPVDVAADSPAFSKGGGGGGGNGGGGGGGGGIDNPPPTPPAPPTVLSGPLYLRESFGFDPLRLGAGTAQRYNTNGDLVRIGLGTSISGFRAEYPNIGSEVWMTPDPKGGASWAFGASSTDPNEPPSTFELPGENGVIASATKPSDLTNNDALLNFLQPSGPVTVSATVYAGPYNVAIGFTPSGVLTNNFETSGAAWLVVHFARTNFLNTPATWELHTNGLVGPSASGTFVSSSFNRLALHFDPDSGTVSATIQGVETSTLLYRVNGVRFVGIQGNGIVNDYRVDAK